MPSLTDIDPDGLLEYSVVFTDRSLNHMSQSFQGVMNDVSMTLNAFTTRIRLFWSRAAAPTEWKRLRASLGPGKNAW